RSQGAEELHDLSIQLHGDEAVALGIEVRRGLCPIADAALERESRRRLEAKEKVPQRSEHAEFENQPTEHRDREQNGAVQVAAERHPRRAEPDEQTEDRPR